MFAAELKEDSKFRGYQFLQVLHLDNIKTLINMDDFNNNLNGSDQNLIWFTSLAIACLFVTIMAICAGSNQDGTNINIFTVQRNLTICVPTATVATRAKAKEVATSAARI